MIIVEINLSENTIHTVVGALFDKKQLLKKQIGRKNIGINMENILKHQLKDVEDALETFTLLMEE